METHVREQPEVSYVMLSCMLFFVFLNPIFSESSLHDRKLPFSCRKGNSLISHGHQFCVYSTHDVVSLMSHSRGFCQIEEEVSSSGTFSCYSCSITVLSSRAETTGILQQRVISCDLQSILQQEVPREVQQKEYMMMKICQKRVETKRRQIFHERKSEVTSLELE